MTGKEEGLLLHPSLSLEEHLSKRPSHEWMINNLDKIEVVEWWFREHEKLFRAKVSQIQDAFDEGKNKYGHYWIYDGPDYARSRCEHVISLYEEETIPKIRAKVLELLVSPSTPTAEAKLMAEGYKDSADDDLAVAKEFEGIEPELEKEKEGSAKVTKK